MSKKCIICNKVKGKRVCKINNDRLICSRCCGEIRGAACEGCSYYQSGLQYQAEKEKAQKERKFIVELNEEIDAAVDEAMAAVEKRKFRKAEKILTGLMQEHPNHHMTLYGMGAFYAMQEKYTEAIEYFKKAVDIFPLFTEAYYNLAITYKSIFDIANMVKALRKVLELSEPGTEYYDNARDLIQVMERSMREKGGAGLEAFINGQDEFDSAYALMERGDWKGAIKGFERSIRWYPDVPQPYGNMGICYAKLGEKQLALSAFDKAIEIDPNYEPAIRNKEATEQLKDGQALPYNVHTIRYYGQNRRNS